MNSIVFDMAGIDDISELVRLRIAYMIDDFGSISEYERRCMEEIFRYAVEVVDDMERPEFDNIWNYVFTITFREFLYIWTSSYIQNINLPATSHRP